MVSTETDPPVVSEERVRKIMRDAAVVSFEGLADRFERQASLSCSKEDSESWLRIAAALRRYAEFPDSAEYLEKLKSSVEETYERTNAAEFYETAKEFMNVYERVAEFLNPLSTS